MTSAEILKQLKNLDADVVRLGHITALLEWDQETYLPSAGARERAAQIALISGLHHEKIVDPEWAKLFASLDEISREKFPDADEAFIRESRKRMDKRTRVSRVFVEEMARETSLSQNAWVAARKSDDFAFFAPHLEKLIALKKEYAEVVAPGKDSYDTLLDEYEPDASGDEIASVFDGLAHGLNPLMDRIRSGKRPADDFLKQPYTLAGQDAFGRKIQGFMGYDTARGRLDISAHPFTTTLGPDDVRVTTRYDVEDLTTGLFGNMHEAGHGLYDQGFGETLRGTLLADGASMGIHESQSRFWENMLGLSREFWERWYPELQGIFPENLEGTEAEEFYRGVNTVQPSLIRIDADEVTYSYHIIIRFRLERALISGDLAVKDLPAAWNDAYSKLLGIDPPNDADGCLQDIHWAAGLFGYFPTYALGNLYAAQFTHTMESEIGVMDTHLMGGTAGAILEWFRRNIHVHGRVYSPGELCRRITGKDLDPGYYLEYLESKYADIYAF